MKEKSDMQEETEAEKRLGIVRKAREMVDKGEASFRRGSFAGECHSCALGMLLRASACPMSHWRPDVFMRLQSKAPWTELQLHAIEEAFESLHLRSRDTQFPLYPVEGKEADSVLVLVVLEQGPEHPLWPLVEARVWGRRKSRESEVVPWAAGMDGDEHAAQHRANARVVGLAILDNMLQNEGLFMPPAVSEEEAAAELGVTL